MAYYWPYLTLTFIKQNVRFQGGIYPKKSQLDQIQNDRLVAAIDFNLLTIWTTVPDS